MQIEDLKSYFDEPEEDEELSRQLTPEDDAAEMLLFSRGARTKNDLLQLVPPRDVAHKFATAFFTSFSPSQREISL